MAQKNPGRRNGVRRMGKKRSSTEMLAAAHAALDDLEHSLRALPGTDHLVDGVLWLRGLVIEAFAFGVPQPPRRPVPTHTDTAKVRPRA